MSAPIVVLAFGTRGDIDPLLALAVGLRDRGHTVRFIAPTRYAWSIHEHGIDIRELGLEFEDAVTQMSWAEWQKPWSTIINNQRSKNALTADLDARIAEVAQACAGARAILSPNWGGMSQYCADAQGIPHAFLQLQPMEPTGEFPHVFLNTVRNYGNWANRASYDLLYEVHWHQIRSATNRFRASRGLAPMPWRVTSALARRPFSPVFCGFSEALVPRPHDWPDHIEITGFWRSPQRLADYQPPDALARFLTNDRPTVFTGFGSWTPPDSTDLTNLFVGAIREAGVRGVVHMNSATVADPHALGDDIYLTRFVPYEWLFPRLAAVVHHGGVGTLARAAEAGVPTVAIPLIGDQALWSQRAHQLGVATRTLNKATIAIPSLAAALRQATTDPGMKTKAAALGDRLRAENGVARACTAVERWLNQTLG